MKRIGLVGCFSLIVVLSSLIGRTNVSAADDPIVDGNGVKGISVGTSTMQDVISRFGQPDETEHHKTYSTELIYSKLGMAFYYCHADPQKEIFVIELKHPFKGTTSKGVRFGESSWEEVWQLYRQTLTDHRGEDPEPVDVPADGKEIDGEGIAFRFKRSGKSGSSGSEKQAYIVDEIDVFEMDGLRQCDSKFGIKTDE